jgi:hypothetical protein
MKKTIKVVTSALRSGVTPETAAVVIQNIWKEN